MSRGWEFLEWIRLSIRHREEELELLRKMESDAYRRTVERGGEGERRGERRSGDGDVGEPSRSGDLPESHGTRAGSQSGNLSQRRDAWKSLDDRIHEAALSPAPAFPGSSRPPGREPLPELSWPESVTPEPTPPKPQGPPRPTASTVTPTPSEHAAKEAYELSEPSVENTPDRVAAAAVDEVASGRSASGEASEGDAVATGDAVARKDDVAAGDAVATPVAAGPNSAERHDSTLGSLLLMEQDGCWVGFPWSEVDRVALTEEIPIGSGHRFRFSLRDLLAQRKQNTGDSPEHRPTEAEPFAVLWKRDHGLSILCCRRFGGITGVEEAVSRRVEWIVRPPRLGDGREPQVERLSEVLHSESSAPADTPSAGLPAGTPVAGLRNGRASNGAGGRHRVLLAVPYLPVRVALSRSFRRADWEVTEEFDPVRVRAAIQDRDYDALFLDLADPMDPGLIQLLEEERFAGLSLVAIGSRFQRPHESPSGRLARAPRLQFPFQDEDVGRVVESLSKR